MSLGVLPFSGRLGCTPRPLRVAGSSGKTSRLWKRTSENRRIWLGSRKFFTGNNHRAAEVTAQISESELLFFTASRAHFDGPPLSTTRDVARAVWDRSCSELLTGVLEEWSTKEQLDERLGVCNWSFIVRFADWLLGSACWRAVDDGTFNGHNGTFSVTERIHTTSSNESMAFWRCCREKLCIPFTEGWQPSAGMKDSPKRDIRALGLVWAVLTFNRCPSFISALPRRWLAIPCTIFGTMTSNSTLRSVMVVPQVTVSTD